MGNSLVIGLQWGDEGKGKVIDHICPNYNYVMRFAGGGNAGHTVVVGNEKFVLHHLPSGVLSPNKIAILGERMVINPISLVKEIEDLRSRNRYPNIKISHLAHVILPEYIEQEKNSKNCNNLGTTNQGIGPTYERKAARSGLRMIDLLNKDLGTEVNEAFKYLYPMITNTFDIVSNAVTLGRKVLFEGAQGVLLDVDYGTYPYCTSSGINDLGIYFRHIDEVIGVFKAYTTRVGTGPFPTELTDDIGKEIQQKGNEVGSTTGRVRRCGWLDLEALKWSIAVSGTNKLAITKLDVLNGMKIVRVCTGYRSKSINIPIKYKDVIDLNDVIPVYTELPGWDDLYEITSSGKVLSKNVVQFLDFIKSEVIFPITYVSTGPERSQMIFKSSAGNFVYPTVR